MRLNTKDKKYYYINESKQNNWSIRELERNIKTEMYHRIVKNQLPSSKTSTEIDSFIKDHYILEFLDIKPV